MNSTGDRTRDAILTFIPTYTAEHGYPPSVREVAEAVGLSTPSAVHAQLEFLRAAGLVTWMPGKTRTLRVLNRDRQ